MLKVLFKAEKREEIGKGAVGKLRRQGMLPAVLYAGATSTPIKIERKEVAKLMASGDGEHALITIKLSGGKTGKKDHWAIVKDYQLDPVKNELIHVDFMEISLEKKIKITTPIIITKEPIGVKNGGILQQQMRDVEIECLPTQIPDGIELDASYINIGHSLHVSDLVIGKEIKVLSDPQDVILTVSAPVIEEVAPVEKEVTEPELVKDAKAKEEEGEEASEGEEEKGQKGQKEQKEHKERKEQKEK